MAKFMRDQQRKPVMFTPFFFLRLSIILLFACLSPTMNAQTINFKEQKLIVTVLESPPFVMKSERGFYGYAIDLWEESAKYMGVKYEYQEVNNLPDLLASITTGNADVAITELTINGERMEKMDFSQPWFDAGLQMMVHKPPKTGFWNFTKQLYDSGLLDSYLFIGLGIFLASIALTLIDRRFDPEFPRKWGEGISESLYHVVSILTTGDTKHKPLFGSFGRVLAAIWLVFGVGVVAFVTSSITSVMTVNSMERRIIETRNKNIQDLPDLKGKTIGTLKDSIASSYVSKAHLSGQEFMTLDEVIKALAENQIGAVVADEPSLTYYLHQYPDIPVTPVGKIIKHEKYGFGLRAGSPLRLKLSKQVMVAWETGFIGGLRNKYFGN